MVGAWDDIDLIVGRALRTLPQLLREDAQNMTDDIREGRARIAGSHITRRTFLKGAASVGIASLGAPLLWPPQGLAAAKKDPALAASSRLPIKHVIVCSQENRSFDHYYGNASFVGSYGTPAGYSQKDKNGNPVLPFHFTTFSTPDVGHSWSAVHQEWNNGNMDGFVIADGKNAMGYYSADRDLPYYASLFKDSTLCVNYFCSVLGPTYPNRFYLVGGTSGGITTNGVYGYGKLDWPIILDLLDAAKVSWKVYNVNTFSDDRVNAGESDNVFVFFKKWQKAKRARASKQDYLNDLKNGTLPHVSFIIDSYTKNYDEHPGFNTDLRRGMGIQRQLIDALRNSRYWKKSKDVAYILTYDEHGGFFDHVAPPKLDAFGAGMRVPTWVISPYAKKQHLEPTTYEHGSILKFIETLFGLPTLASKNSKFNSSTPTGTNYQAGGKPAPPRDRLSTIGNLTECFDFTTAP
jgi:phospholipase C